MLEQHLRLQELFVAYEELETQIYILEAQKEVESND